MKDKLLDMIDSLPGGIEWNLHEIHLTGDLKDDNGKLLTETLELWWWDLVECIQELMGNPMFWDVMRYAPEKVFTDAGGKNEFVSEMWTAE